MSLLAQKLSSRQAAAFWYTKCRNSSRTFRPTCGHAGNLVALSQWPVGAHCVLHHSDLIVRRLNGCSAISTGSTDVVVWCTNWPEPSLSQYNVTQIAFSLGHSVSGVGHTAISNVQSGGLSQATRLSVHYSINEHRPKSFRPKTRRRKTKNIFSIPLLGESNVRTNICSKNLNHSVLVGWNF